MDPFIGEIRLLSFDFPPRGWASCDGQQLATAQYQALFSLLGTTYGGDGRTTFNLPDLRTRAAMHFSADYRQGGAGGAATSTLTPASIPPHNHEFQVTAAAGDDTLAVGNYVGSFASAYAPPANNTITFLDPATVSSVGGEPHENRQPYLTMQYAIALQGVYPTRD